jgi:glutamate-1-semialdehyde 2,1-aminomutase
MRKHHGDLYEAISMELVARGVIPDPDAREPWFVCAAHDDAAIEETLVVFAEAVEVVKESGLADREPPEDVAE